MKVGIVEEGYISKLPNFLDTAWSHVRVVSNQGVKK